VPSGDRSIRDHVPDSDRKLVELALTYRDNFAYKRWIFEREWYRNILYYLGQQWIVYDEGWRRWRQRNLASWVPMPVTNRLASTANVIRSSVAQVTPAFNAMPTEDNEKSVLSANAADKYLDVIMQESGFRAARRRLASWITLTGNGFLLTEFDTSDDTGMVSIPGELCGDCGLSIAPADIPESMKCPRCGSDNLTEDANSSTSVPQGRIRVTSLPPFEVYVDNRTMELQDQPAILIIQNRSLDAVRMSYGDAAKDVQCDNERDMGRYFLDSLAYMTGTGFSGGAFRRGPDETDGGVTLYHLFVKCCKDYPDGFTITMTGDQHVLDRQIPYPHRFQRTQKPFYPVVHVRYDDVPGRFWAKTPIDDLVAKQRQRNEMESLYQTIIMRSANPVWLIPTGVQHTPITGDPSIQVRYSGAGGLKPERIKGEDAPHSIPAFIQQIDQDFEEIANTFAVMKGKSPGSVRAASAIQMLLERGFGRYGSVFDNLEEAYEQWAVQALEIWRQKAIFPRVQAVAKTAGSWQFMEFLGADLGEVDIRVEAGSTRPKSQAGRQMLIGQGLQWGLLNANDPEQKMKMFEELGMVSLLPGAEADTKVVAEENAKFMAWASSVQKGIEDQQGDPNFDPQGAISAALASFPLEGNPILDHHPTHLVHHRRLGLTDGFRQLPKVLQDMFVQHILQAHYQYMLMEQQTGMGPTGVMGAMAMQQPQGQGAASSGNPAPGRTPQQGGGPGGATNKSKMDMQSPSSVQNRALGGGNQTLDSGTVPR
jgi:hypothetical protein